MNTDYNELVKTMRENVGRKLHETPNVTNYETRLGDGSMYFPIIYFLCFSNALILSQRYGLGSSRLFFIGSIVASYPISYLICRYGFGYTKYRQLAEQEKHNYISNQTLLEATKKI